MFYNATSTRDFVHSCTDHGILLFPLHRIVVHNGKARCTCSRPGCTQLGKHPLVKWKHLDEPPTKKEISRYIFKDPSMQGGFGIKLGPSNLVCLDIDPKNGGDETAATLFAAHGEPATLTVRTGSGGRHYYFRAPNSVHRVGGFDPSPVIYPEEEKKTDILLTAVQVGPGVEFFAGRHYMVAPFSPHKSGARYEITNAVEPAEAPEWLLEFVRAKLRERDAEAENRKKQHEHGQQLLADYKLRPPGTVTVASGAASIVERAYAYVSKIPPAVSGQGGSARTSHVACTLLIDFELSFSDAMPIFQAWNANCEPPWTDEELFRKLEWADSQPGERGRLANATFNRHGDEEINFTLIWPEPKKGKKVAGKKIADAAVSVKGKIMSINEAVEEALRDLVLKTSPPAAFAPAKGDFSCCPTKKKVIHEDVVTGAKMTQFHDCRRMNCPHCHKQHRKQWKNTIRKHLHDHAAEAAKMSGSDVGDVMVWLFNHDVSNHPNLQAVMKRARENYACVCTNIDEDESVVVSTIAPPASQRATNVRQVNWRDAADRLCSAIDNLAEIERSMFRKSHAWKLTDELPPSEPIAWLIVNRNSSELWWDGTEWSEASLAKQFKSPETAKAIAKAINGKVIPQKKWRFVAEIKSDFNTCLEILKHHGVTPRDVFARTECWQWSGVVWNDRQCTNGTPAQLVENIKAGEILPTEADIMKLFERGDPKDFFDDQARPAKVLVDTSGEIDFW